MRFSSGKIRPVPARLPLEDAPAPHPEPPKWRRFLAWARGGKGHDWWGERFLRVTSDLFLVCDENLEIVFHNHAFLREIGYEQGTYAGRSLCEFFLAGDRVEVRDAIGRLMRGRPKRMRFQTSLLTRRGMLTLDASVTRTRRGSDGFLLYVVARSDAPRAEQIRELERKLHAAERRENDLILANLPLAMFRTDGRLRVTEASGGLWAEMGVNPRHLLGADVSDASCTLGPRFLHEIDYCDTMAGMTFHTEVEWQGERYEITIEPFADTKRGGQVDGTLAILRRSKQVVARRDRNILHESVRDRVLSVDNASGNGASETVALTR
jgi:PAS domain S-box-containing protein